jgi:hypothetical protein
MTFEVRRPLDSGLAAIVVGAGRDAAPLDHLVPHNALEWALYLGVLAVIVAVLIYEWRNRNRNRNAIPGLRVRRLRRTRPEPEPTAADGAAAPGPDDAVDDEDTRQ